MSLQEGPEAAVPWSVPWTGGERGAGSRLRAWRAPSQPGRLQNRLPAAPPADHTPHYPVPLSKAGFLEKCLRVFVCACVCRHVFVCVCLCVLVRTRIYACVHVLGVRGYVCTCTATGQSWVSSFIAPHSFVFILNPVRVFVYVHVCMSPCHSWP